MIRKIYEIELMRFQRFEKIILVIVTFISSISATLLITPFQADYNMLINNLKDTMNNLFVIFGIILPVFSQTFFAGDYKYGILATYLSYPISPVEFALGKLLSQFTYYFIASFISLLLLIFIFPYTLKEQLLIIFTFLLLMLLLYIITFFSLILIKYQPLPQFFTIAYFLMILYGETSTNPRWYIINPISFIFDFIGHNIHNSQILMYGLISIPFYATLFLISYYALNKMEWGGGI